MLFCVNNVILNNNGCLDGCSQFCLARDHGAAMCNGSARRQGGRPCVTHQLPARPAQKQLQSLATILNALLHIHATMRGSISCVSQPYLPSLPRQASPSRPSISCGSAVTKYARNSRSASARHCSLNAGIRSGSRGGGLHVQAREHSPDKLRWEGGRGGLHVRARERSPSQV